MLTQMIQIENHKLTRRAMFWVELGLMAAVVVLMTVFLLAIKQVLDSGVTERGGFRVEGMSGPQVLALLTWPMGFIQALDTARTWGIFLLVVLSGALTAQEYGWRSFQLWVSRGVPRWSVLAAKFVAVIVAALLLVGTAVLLGGLVSGILSIIYLEELPYTAVNWGYLALAAVTAAYTLLPYATLAMLLAVLSRSTALTVGGGLAFVALIEPLAVQLLPMLGNNAATVASYLPASLAQAANSHIAGLIPVGQIPDFANAANTVNPYIALFLLGAYTLLALGTAVALFQRQELGG